MWVNGQWYNDPNTEIDPNKTAAQNTSAVIGKWGAGPQEGSGTTNPLDPTHAQLTEDLQKAGYTTGSGMWSPTSAGPSRETEGAETNLERYLNRQANFWYGGEKGGADEAVMAARAMAAEGRQPLDVQAQGLERRGQYLGTQYEKLGRDMLARQGPQTNYEFSPEDRARQQAAYGALMRGFNPVAVEEGPSAAQAQLQQGTNAAMAQQLALARSGRGSGESASALRGAAFNQAGLQQGLVNQSAMLRAQEVDALNQRRLQAGLAAQGLTAQGYQAAGGLAGGMRAQDIGQAQFGTTAELQAQEQNARAALGYAGLGANAQLGYESAAQQGYGTSANLGMAGEAQAAAIRDAQLRGSMGYENNLSNYAIGMNPNQQKEKGEGWQDYLQTGIGVAGVAASFMSDIQGKTNISQQPGGPQSQSSQSQAPSFQEFQQYKQWLNSQGYNQQGPPQNQGWNTGQPAQRNQWAPPDYQQPQLANSSVDEQRRLQGTGNWSPPPVTGNVAINNGPAQRWRPLPMTGNTLPSDVGNKTNITDTPDQPQPSTPPATAPAASSRQPYSMPGAGLKPVAPANQPQAYGYANRAAWAAANPSAAANPQAEQQYASNMGYNNYQYPGKPAGYQPSTSVNMSDYVFDRSLGTWRKRNLPAPPQYGPTYGMQNGGGLPPRYDTTDKFRNATQTYSPGQQPSLNVAGYQQTVSQQNPQYNYNDTETQKQMAQMSDKRAKHLENENAALSKQLDQVSEQKAIEKAAMEVIPQAQMPRTADMTGSPGYYYDYKDQSNGVGRQFGPMAQDLAKQPATAHTVVRRPDGYLGVDTPKLTMANTGAISEMQRQLDALQAQKALEQSAMQTMPTAEYPVSDAAAKQLREENAQLKAQIPQVKIQAYADASDYWHQRQGLEDKMRADISRGRVPSAEAEKTYREQKAVLDALKRQQGRGAGAPSTATVPVSQSANIGMVPAYSYGYGSGL
jgi:hypothetical protein